MRSRRSPSVVLKPAPAFATRKQTSQTAKAGAASGESDRVVVVTENSDEIERFVLVPDFNEHSELEKRVKALEEKVERLLDSILTVNNGGKDTPHDTTDLDKSSDQPKPT